MVESSIPKIIQGGMGVGISNWRLAQAVSKEGSLGVVSGTGIAVKIARELQNGDPDETIRDSLSRFPDQGIARQVADYYFVPGGKSPDKGYKPVPMYTSHRGWRQRDQALLVVANFVEVDRAKQGHNNKVGVNYLTELQEPHLLSLYGAMLAGVDVVLMGAGIPFQIPRVLDDFAKQQPSYFKLDVLGSQKDDDFRERFNPAEFSEITSKLDLKRPDFLPIIASDTLAKAFIKRAEGEIQGFIIEGPTAGGHNAPPRGKYPINPETGEPIYGERDIVDLKVIRELGKPFWLAGSYASPAGLATALSEGAAGIQVGSIFALSDESGIDSGSKQHLRQRALEGQLNVLTSAEASPSGYPFKVAQVEFSVSNPDIYQSRHRICDIGYLREAYRTGPNQFGLRCPAEPIDDYLAKGGKLSDTEKRQCLCNTLFAAIGLGQTHQIRGERHTEPPIFTMGDDLSFIHHLMKDQNQGYAAIDVLRYLRSVC